MSSEAAAAHTRSFQKAKDTSLEEMQDRAKKLGANAVIGIDLDYETIGESNSMLMVSASGTAVVVERER